jgi:hypothetical protein
MNSQKGSLELHLVFPAIVFSLPQRLVLERTSPPMEILTHR